MSVAQNDAGMKLCSADYGCGQWKPAGEFWKNDIACKDCRRKRKVAIEAGSAPKMRKRGGAAAPASRTMVDEAPRVDPAYAIMPYGNAVVAFEQDYSLVCITDIWRAAGSPENLRPNDWLREDGEGARLIEAFSRGFNANPSGIKVTRSGRGDAGAGTWLPREIALAYAQRLNPDLWLACNRFVLSRAQPSQPAQPVAGFDPDERKIIRMIGQMLGLIKEDTTAIRIGLDGATVTPPKEMWKGQNYICRLIGPEYVALTRRQYKGIPDGADIIFVGKTKPDGNVGAIRLVDYGGKWDLEPADYEVIAVFGTDDPGEVEKALLHNPLPGCLRMTHKKSGQKSMTFLSAMAGAEKRYQVFTRRHYTLSAVRLVLCGVGGQIEMFGGTA